MRTWLTEDVVLFTIGYEGRSLAGYLDTLATQDIRLLCDVRKNPISRKPGFSKSALLRGAESQGITYRHFPGLGIPSAKRRNLKTSDCYHRLFDDYESTTLREGEADLTDLANLLERYKKIALTCFEADADRCHRRRVAEAVRQRAGRSCEVSHI